MAGMMEEVAGMREEMARMKAEMGGLREKLQWQEEINKLKIQRMEEIPPLIDNKPSDTVSCGSNNDSSLVLAVLQLSSTLGNLQTGRGEDDRHIQDNVTEQMSKLIYPRRSSSVSNITHGNTTVDTLANGLSEIQSTVEALQAKVEGLAAPGDGRDQELSSRGNTTTDSSQGLISNSVAHSHMVKPRYCHDIYIQGGRRDGVFEIYPGWNVSQSVKVWCEFDVGSEVGWTIILARMPTEEPVNFSRGWDDYKAGFGDAHNEYWIGLLMLHEIMLAHCSQVLQISLHSWDQTTRNAQYKDFSIGDEESGYKLYVGGYSGDAGDSLALHNGMMFTTKDRDNDEKGTNCATYAGRERGGFWYKSCFHTNPFGVLRKKAKGDNYGIRWYKWLGDVNLKKIIFKISPRLPSLI
ncbi:unnamed protein product [Meganyctiphanes norvegica]|uniref:Fibrinogen C-terminal domain-containing protein n=1 Tax=Meganyctiphanes norvegica TaxID=48144 RepID=A0AAV2Q6A5_MEGNR